MVTFWQNIPSIHQSALLRELACLGEPVRLVVERPDVGLRARSGWSVPDFGGVTVWGPERAREALGAARESDVHVFSGTKRGTLARWALERLVETPAVLGVMGETGDWVGIKGILRKTLCRMDARKFGARLSFVLAMGSLGREWYVNCGFDPGRVLPFAYFIEPSVDTPGNSAASTFELLFAGRLTHQKGVDLLLRALEGIDAPRWGLTIIGEGPAEPKLRVLAARLFTGERVRFVGRLGNREVRRRMAGVDLVVLPSRSKDGWGAVVGEALSEGTPAVCTTACGARDLLNHAVRGRVVTAGSMADLRRAILEQMAGGPQSRVARDALRAWSTRIQGRAGARYLSEVLSATRVGAELCQRPPWIEGSG